jgi:hypothetical protein
MVLAVVEAAPLAAVVALPTTAANNFHKLGLSAKSQLPHRGAGFFSVGEL